jgi:hypothetical protein
LDLLFIHITQTIALNFTKSSFFSKEIDKKLFAVNREIQEKKVTRLPERREVTISLAISQKGCVSKISLVMLFFFVLSVRNF